MRTSVAFLCVLATVSIASATRLISTTGLVLPGLSDAPDFCHGLECPPFKMLKNTSQYQLREYEGGKAPRLIAPSILPASSDMLLGIHLLILHVVGFTKRWL